VKLVPYAPESAFMDDTEPDPPSADRPPTIVALSRHDPRKGVSFLIRALARLRTLEPGFRARLLGPGPLLEAHRRLISELGVSQWVTAEGFVDNPIAELRRARVLVLPSFEEGSGAMAVLEAFQAGVPVVAAACDGVTEDVEHEVNGLLFEPGSSEELVGSLRRILGDTALTSRLCVGARRTFVERFAARPFGNALRAIYDSVCDGTFESGREPHPQQGLPTA
jgi:glycosyltransferase involved in cell wall biosynthesis